MKIMCYTDYPLGQQDNAVVHVELLAYDRDKYCRVSWNGAEPEEVKSGYLYADPALTRRIRFRDLLSVPQELGQPRRTRRDVAQELRAERKFRTNYHLTVVGESNLDFESLAKALQYVKYRVGNANYLLVRSRWCNSQVIAKGEDGYLFSYLVRNQKIPVIKHRHINRVSGNFLH